MNVPSHSTCDLTHILTDEKINRWMNQRQTNRLMEKIEREGDTPEKNFERIGFLHYTKVFFLRLQETIIQFQNQFNLVYKYFH